MSNESSNQSWLVRCGVFIFHVFVAMVGSVIVTMFLALIVERFTGQRVGDLIFGGPLFFGSLFVGFFFGFSTSDSLNLKSGQWVWIVALGAFCIILQDQVRTPSPQGVLHDIWVDYFGNSNCGETECLYELLGTWPLFSSIGYSLGSLAGRSSRSNTPSQSKPSDVAST